MDGFPRHIATHDDFTNLLGMDEYKDEALEKLRELAAFDDRVVTRAVQPIDPNDPMGEWEVEEIDNPYPLHAQKGFIDTEQKVKADKIKQGWFKIPELIASVDEKSYEEVLEEFAEITEVKPIKDIGVKK